MSARSRVVLLRMAGVILVVGVGFVLLQQPARRLEARASTALLQACGASGVSVAAGSSVLVVPSGHAPFRAIVTPSCSSLASALAIGALAALAPARRRRRAAATGAAVATVVAGNVLRISLSLAVGLVAGRASLVLFHDWVGSMFGFAYTLGGYVLLLYLLLPACPRTSSSLLPAPALSSC
ncbi:MAG: hypothetical protein JO086_04205 [Acidimicrobiia bacterium]|nr:hypothetical protein [Acidimicrobiia bacterium]